MPFARNDATRFISPTKTPEYLAAGRPVISTPIRDVVRTYGEAGLAAIVDDPSSCIAAIEAALAQPRLDPHWLARVDAYLDRMSWDQTFHDMWRLVEKCLAQRSAHILAHTSRSSATPSLAVGTAAAAAVAGAKPALPPAG
jgi:UDP-galactopyranose mutase